MKKILRILSITFAVVIFLVGVFAALTQTSLFREKLRSIALANLDSLLDAEVQLGEITGNLIGGFSINSISITVQNEPLLIAERLDLRYDLFEIPSRKVGISGLTLVRPSVRLSRGRDGVWNFERMVRPSPTDTLEKEPFDWPIAIKKLEIEDGTIILADSAALAEADHPGHDPYYVEYHQFILRQFHLTTSALIKPGEVRAVISALSFVSDQPDIQLAHFSGDLWVTPREARARNMIIKTSRSSIRLDAYMSDIDLLGGVELEHFKRNPVRLSLHAHDIDLSELKRFIPQIDFLNDTVALDLEAEGEFGDLNLKRLDMKMGKSELYFRGQVLNLHRPGDLYMSLKCTESKLHPPDAANLLAGLELPRFDSLGVTTLNLEYDGTPLDFATKFLLETKAGNVRADVSMKIGGRETLAYKADLLAQRLDLGRVFENEALSSKLNGTVKISGKGVSIDQLASTARLEIDSSNFMGQELAKSQVTVEASERIITGNLNVALGPMRSVLSVELSDQNPVRPAFRINGQVSSLNLQDFLRDNSHNSDLTMSLKAEGTGLTWGELNGDLLLNFSPSRYKQYKISSGNVHLFLDQRDSLHKEVRLESNIADFFLNGSFDIEYIASLIAYQSQNIQLALGEKFRSLDTTLAASVDTNTLRTWGRALASRPKALNAQYSLHLKNLEPLSIVTGNRVFDGVGVLNGTIQGDYHNLSLGGQFVLEDFFYGSADSGILIQDGIATFDINNLQPREPLKGLDVRFHGTADRMHINRDKLDSLRFTLAYQDEYARYNVRLTYGEALRATIHGLAGVTENEVTFRLNDLRLGLGEFRWAADSGATIAFNSTNVRLEHVVMRRDSQKVTIGGSLGAGGSLDAMLVAEHLNLKDLKYFLEPSESGANIKGFEGHARFSLTVGGTLHDPMYSIIARANNVFYRGVPFGKVYGNLQYADGSLQIDAAIDNRADTTFGSPALTVRGSLPIDLSLSEDETTSPERPMNLNVQSRGIQMSLLNPLLPTFNDLVGILRTDLSIVGSPKNPDFHGSIAIDSCAFLFVPNNMYYTFEGRFQPEGNRIEVLDATVRNIRADNRFGRDGVLHILGDFTLREFVPTDFRLNASGQLLVVSRTTRASALSVFGDLFVEIEPPGLSYTGTIDQSTLRGRVLVRNSSLVFPPTEATVQTQTNFAIPVQVVDDTSAVVAQQARTAIARYFGTDARSGQPLRIGEGLPAKTFLDGLRYDLDIEASGANTEIRMIFNTATNEELVAHVYGMVNITEDGKQWVGKVSVERSYYNFYGKRFDAHGTLAYSGDFLDPELDITAEYQGTRVVPDTTQQRTEKVIVVLRITGSRKEPKLDISMNIDDQDYYAYKKGPTSGDVQTDALAFIITGSFPLNRGQRNDVASDVGTSVGSSLLGGATSLLTSALSDFLKNRTGFITSVELSYGRQGTFGQAADIRLSGVAFKGLWRYGGRILDDPFNNANFSVLYSFGDIFNQSSLRNFMFELERKVDLGTYGQAFDRKEINSARLFYRFSF